MGSLCEQLRLPWMLWNGRDVVRGSSGSTAQAALPRSWGALAVLLPNKAGNASEPPTLSWDRPVLGQLTQYLGSGPMPEAMIKRS